ncbi:SEC-C domain-containing protein [Acetivibrio mesophilus]|uniref:SEC-C domain-containing protein n=1 Tax=Acetivibrio mesophilus TaxID=2487273 RepID=A0A4Q0I0A0_9FIRM|nr:SEC-C domain-containing protein [Acetivibrio mesophilus]RXE57620.1 SEC-C domain-containing protein [Acetivibrio mesophilus]
MFKSFIFNGKEQCPCGSGSLYKDCCKVKEPRQFRTEGEFLNYMGQTMRKSRIKTCLVKGCTAKGKAIIGAHALQENRILNKLEANKEVYMQDFTKDPKMLEIEKGKREPFYLLDKVLIKDATVATCFCKTHDDLIFAKIEKFQYTLDTLDEEQLFLFAYKTFAFELYTEIVSKKFQSHMFAGSPQLTKDPSAVQKYINTDLKLQDLQYYRDYFDTALAQKDYSGLETVVIELPFRVQFANYMAVAPPFDLRGKKIKSIDRTKRMRFVFSTTFPLERKSYFLVTALKSDLNVYFEYLEQIRNFPIGLIQYYINVFIPLYSQNLITSPTLWDSWSEMGQYGVQFTVADPQSIKLLMAVKFHLQNISKASKKEEIKIDTSNMPFDFFIPYTPRP